MTYSLESSAHINSCHGESDEQDFCYAEQLVTLTSLPMALHSAIQLELLEVLAKSGSVRLSAAEIVDSLGIHNADGVAMVDRILRLLASYSVVSCSLGESNVRVYGMASVTKYFVGNEDGVSFAPQMCFALDKMFFDSWYKVKEAIVEGGIPFNKVHGMDAFELAGKDQRFNKVLNAAMLNHTNIYMKRILDIYKGLENLKQVVDVGGGLGIVLSMITTKYPSIKGINFDLPHVIEQAPPHPGVEHVGGDMFESVPVGDAIFMKCVLHDWNDEHCIKLLKNCYKALPDNGKVISVEAILPEAVETSAAMKTIGQIDLVIMTQNPGGKERTKQEFFNLAYGAGFSGIRFECRAGNYWVMEFYK